MRPPHTATLYLRPAEGAPWHRTVLRGVFLEEVRGASPGPDGASDAGDTRLWVPFGTPAAAPDGTARHYMPPAEFLALDAPADAYTLVPGGTTGMADCFFLRGESTLPGEAAILRPDAVRVRRVAVRDWGNEALRHFEVTGR